MMLRRWIPAALLCLLPAFCFAQSSFVAPDGKNRYPGVTIFCPNGNGVTPCNFAAGGSGGSNGTVSIQSGGAAVSTSNRFPVAEPSLDALISGGALTIGGAVSLSGTPSVVVAAGTAAIGSVSIQSGNAAVSASNRLPVAEPSLDALISGGALTIGGAVSLSGTPSVVVAAGSAAIGSVSVSNLPASQAVTAAALPLPAGAATSAAQTATLAPVSPGAATATNAVVIGCVANTTLPSFAVGQQGAVPCDTSGRPYVVTVPSSNNVPAYLQAVSSGGAAVYRAINAASSAMAASVKASSGMVYGYEACNAGTGAAYLRLFAVATAPVAGTSTPAVSKLLPAGTCQGYSSTVGLTFSNGIGVDVTSGSMADSDSTAVSAANQVSVEVYYK